MTLIVSTWISCSNGKNAQKDKMEETPKVIFSELFNLDRIDGVTIENISGIVPLSKDQLIKFKNEISKTTFVGCCPVKPGSINIIFTIEGKEYYANCHYGGDLILFSNNFPFNKKLFESVVDDIYFEMPKGMNLDNYKK